MASIVSSPAVVRTAPPAWRARAVEWLLVGGITPLLYPLSILLRRALGLDAAEYAVGFTMFYGAFVINDPHFAVTYFLFYEDARGRALGAVLPPMQRVRYWLAGAVVPLALATWGIGAVLARSAYALGLLLQLMFLLVGWHYVKQGFGVMTTLSGRRGVTFTRFERRAILAHCFAGWAYSWASPADPGRDLEEKGVVYRSIAHSRALEDATHAVALLTLVVLAGTLVRKWRRERRLPIATPLVALLMSIWTWSIYSSIDPLVRYVVPALHSLQYLFMVSLYKGAHARERQGPPWFETAAGVRVATLAASALGLGWVLFHGMPTALDDMLTPKRSADTDLGPTPWFAATYAFVNIHHYVMDSVLWRRESPALRYLRAPVPVVESADV